MYIISDIHVCMVYPFQTFLQMSSLSSVWKTLCVCVILAVFALSVVYYWYASDKQTNLNLRPTWKTINVLTSTKGNDTGILMPPNSRLVNKVILEYDARLREEFQRLVDLKVAEDNVHLLSVVVQMLDPPSKTMIKRSRQLFETPQSKAVMSLLKNKVNNSNIYFLVSVLDFCKCEFLMLDVQVYNYTSRFCVWY